MESPAGFMDADERRYQSLAGVRKTLAGSRSLLNDDDD